MNLQGAWKLWSSREIREQLNGGSDYEEGEREGEQEEKEEEEEE